MSNPAAIHDRAVEIARLSVHMATAAGSGHPSSACSIAHLIAQLFHGQMRFDPADPWSLANDRLVLSEGHAVPAVYAAYALIGGVIGRDRDSARKLTVKDLKDLRERDSLLDGHPNPAEGFPFFDAATGSLGQGLSVAAGLGLAAKNDKSDRRIYCIVGDGESREGQIWEAIDFIVDHALTNVCTIFNCNGHGQASAVSAQQSADTTAAKLAAFGVESEIIDGHDAGQVAAAFEKYAKATKPFAIVAKTVKGWGVDKLLSGNWHGKPLADGDLADADKSLDRARDAVASERGTLAEPVKPKAAGDAKRPEPKAAEWPSFEEALKAAGSGAAFEKRKLATRRAYGIALKVAGDVLPQVCALDADVSNSTFTNIFGDAHADRFYECKIAEQNMVSAAVGLAAAGMIPFANSFAKFLARAYDQVELASVGRANIKLVGSHAGISPCADGPSQMALSDVAYFRSFGTALADDRKSPLCWSFQPADAIAAYRLTQLMVEHDGMCFMRTHRPDVPFLYDEDTKFVPGGLHVLRSGEDVTLISSGYALHIVLEAADALAQQNVRATIVDAYSLPIDSEKVIDAIRRGGGRALVVEDNYGGGLGSAVAEVVASVGGLRSESLTCRRIPKSTREPAEEFEYCGVSAGQIADHTLAMLKQPT